MFQYLYGCQWNDETETTTGFEQFGYDGEDLLTLESNYMSYIASLPQAVVTKQKWDHDKATLEHFKNYLIKECPEWLKKYVQYGRGTLERTGTITYKMVTSVTLRQ